MSDRQPLLNISKKLSFDDDDDNEDNKQPSIKKYDRNKNKFQEKCDEFYYFFIVYFVRVNGSVRKKMMMLKTLTRRH
jgi:hypothetical protein